MSNYVFIESKDPFDSPDTSFVAEAAVALKKKGHSVTVFLVQNGVLGARKQVRRSQLSAVLESGVTVVADDLSLRERGISAEECAAGLKPGTIDLLVDLLAQDNTKAIWH